MNEGIAVVPKWFKGRQRSPFRGEFHTSFPVTNNLARCISIFSCINIWQCPLKRDLLTWNCWSNSTCLSNHWDIIKFPPLGAVAFLIHLLTSSRLCQKRMLWNIRGFFVFFFKFGGGGWDVVSQNTFNLHLSLYEQEWAHLMYWMTMCFYFLQTVYTSEHFPLGPVIFFLSGFKNSS